MCERARGRNRIRGQRAEVRCETAIPGRPQRSVRRDQDSLYFSYRFRTALGEVIGWDDQLRLRAIQMRAPIRDDAVAALGCVAPAAVADDRVIWNAGGDRKFVDQLHEAIVRVERIDTVR